MKKMVVRLTAALLFLFANQALADDASNLLAQCNVAVDIMDGKKLTPDIEGSVDAGNAMYCFGLLQGVIRLNRLYEVFLGKNALFCTPDSIVTNGQAARIVVDYLKEHPEMLHEPDFAVTINAFIDTFPCK